MSDTIIHAIAFEGWASVLLSDTTRLVAAAQSVHALSPLATAALGRLLTMGALMGEQLKSEEESFALTIKGDGPLGALHVAAHTKGLVRGYVEHADAALPKTPQGKLDVGGGVGQGTLSVVRMRQGYEPYSCTVPLQTGEIAEDFAHYFVASVQQPSAVMLGVRLDRESHNVLTAGGMLLQIFPGCPDEVVDQVEAFAKNLPQASLMFAEKTPGQALKDWFGDDCEVVYTGTPELFCTCSREAMCRAVQGLPQADRDALAAEGGAELSCRYCGTSYRIAPAEFA